MATPLADVSRSLQFVSDNDKFSGSKDFAAQNVPTVTGYDAYLGVTKTVGTDAASDKPALENGKAKIASDKTISQVGAIPDITYPHADIVEYVVYKKHDSHPDVQKHNVYIHYIDVSGKHFEANHKYTSTDGSPLNHDETAYQQVAEGSNYGPYTPKWDYKSAGWQRVYEDPQINTVDTMGKVDANYYIYLTHAHKQETQYAWAVEIIHYVYASDPNKQISNDYDSQNDPQGARKIEYQRTADTDLVSGKIISYSDWTLVPKQQFNDFRNVTSPKIDHYTPDYKVVEAPTIQTKDLKNGQTHAYVRVVKYTANGQKKVPESRTVNETIHYIYGNGPKKGQVAKPDYKDKREFNRTNIVDAATDEVISHGDWNSVDPFKKVTSPAIKGYKPDQTYIPTYPVSADSHDITKYVYYYENQKSATETKTVNETIYYIYGNGPKVGQTAAADYKDSRTFTRTNIVDAATGEIISYGNWNSVDPFGQVNSPAINGYKPDQAYIQSYKVNADSHDITKYVYYYENQKPATETKTVNETINYIYGNGPKVGQTAASDYKDSRTFTRTNIVDAATGEVISHGDWNSVDPFQKVNSPAIKGYKPDQDFIPSYKVDANSLDIVRTVYYYENQKPVVQKHNVYVHYIDVSGKQFEADHNFVPSDGPELQRETAYEQVAEGANYGPYTPQWNYAVDGWQRVYQDPQISTVDQMGKGDVDYYIYLKKNQPKTPSTPNIPKTPTNPGNPKTPSTPANPGTPSTPVTPVQPGTPQQTTPNNKGHQAKLPQTGDQNNSEWLAAGLGLLGLSCLLGLGKKRRF